MKLLFDKQHNEFSQLKALMKCVRNAAKRSYACLVVCPESRFSELLLLSRYVEELQDFRTDGSADQEDRISRQSPGNVQSNV